MLKNLDPRIMRAIRIATMIPFLMFCPWMVFKSDFKEVQVTVILIVMIAVVGFLTLWQLTTPITTESKSTQ